MPDADEISRRPRALVLDVTQAAAGVSRFVHEARDLNLPVEPGLREAKRGRPLGSSSTGGAAVTKTRELTDLVPDLVPVEVLTEVTTAIAVLEIQGPAIAEALRQLDRATTMAWKAAKTHGMTDDEWGLVKREIGIDRGWDAANQLFSALDLPGLQPSIDLTPESP